RLNHFRDYQPNQRRPAAFPENRRISRRPKKKKNQNRSNCPQNPVKRPEASILSAGSGKIRHLRNLSLPKRKQNRFHALPPSLPLRSSVGRTSRNLPLRSTPKSGNGQTATKSCDRAWSNSMRSRSGLIPFTRML